MLNEQYLDLDLKQLIVELGSAYKLIVETEGRKDSVIRVLTPFYLHDGDHVSIVLKRYNNQWLFSEEGKLYFYLNQPKPVDDYDKMIKPFTEEYHTINTKNELISIVKTESFYEAFYDLIQTILSAYFSIS